MQARGPVLRDKYVLRLIAFDRFTHVVVLVTLAVLPFAFGRHHAALQQDYNHIMDDLSGATPGTVQARGVLVHLKSIFNYSPNALRDGPRRHRLCRARGHRWSACGSPRGGPST